MRVASGALFDAGSGRGTSRNAELNSVRGVAGEDGSAAETEESAGAAGVVEGGEGAGEGGDL